MLAIACHKKLACLSNPEKRNIHVRPAANGRSEGVLCGEQTKNIHLATHQAVDCRSTDQKEILLILLGTCTSWQWAMGARASTEN